VPHLESLLPVWIGVGGSPESVVRAARYGFSLMLAIIGGSPSRFAPFSEQFRQSLTTFGHPARPLGIHVPGHVAETDEQAEREFWPHWRLALSRVARERGFSPPTRETFAFDTGPEAPCASVCRRP
jgi:alkanesulfonate monooxygenase SsuD/methylene tetrahydromethanopterin reductase-like flavin-dependent oxidoreductase (luciferase family)